MQQMDCDEEDLGFEGRLIAPEILSLPARHVLRHDKVRDPLSLRMNLLGALKNWRDVAASLGYDQDKILGLFAHHERPGLSLLEDWMYEENGILEKLVSVLGELRMHSCLEVVYECVEEYEKRSRVRNHILTEDDDDSDRQPSSLTSESSVSSENPLVFTITDYSTEQETSITSNPSSSDSVTGGIETDDEGTVKDCISGKPPHGRVSNDNCQSADSLKTLGTELEVVKRPPFLSCRSWSPERTCQEPDNGQRSALSRSNSQPADTDKKKKSPFKKVFHRFSRKWKRDKKDKSKSPVQTNHELNSCTSLNTGDSSIGTSTTVGCTSFTATNSYNEPAEKTFENFSPLKLDTKEARRLSLTDSLSSGESVSQPTSPGYESGYNSSEGPSVSSGKSISIIHCSDQEGEAFRKKIFELYDYFSKTLGYKCYLDKLEVVKIAENMFRYVVQRVKQSDFLFICVSPQLKSLFDSSADEISDKLEDDESCMLRLVSDLILNDLANNAGNRKGKFMTIILEGSSKKDVPCFLESYMKFSWPKDERRIRCIIEGQPEITPAPISDVRTDPPSQVVRPAELL